MNKITKDQIKKLKPSATLAINEKSNELKKRGKKIFKFGFGQSPFPIPDSIILALKNSAHKNTYLPMQGLEELRSAIAKDLNNEIKEKIKKAIRVDASPRHVPSKIIAISEIPKTKNGKLVELAVKQSIEGQTIKNLEALANPDSLKQFKNIKELNE